MSSAVFKTRDLTAVVGDNAADGGHRAGYNGVWSLRHSAASRDLFVPGICGLNLEHIFDGETDDSAPAVFFEPRHAPMELRKISENEAELHQPPTPTFHLESWTKFTTREPDVLDFEFRCMARQHVFKRGYIGLFWANYINAPEDKSIYFVSGQDPASYTWQQLSTQFHNDQSTVRHRDDATELTFRQANRASLFRSISTLRYSLPLFYGNFDDLVWIVMFDRSEGVRLCHSPSGGGHNAERRTQNPAWDWQYIVPKYDVMKPYGYRARTVLRKKCSRQEILDLYAGWTKSLES